jgi:hypothetical protein
MRSVRLNEKAYDIDGPRVKQVLDHLILGIANLDKGVAWVEEMTGVRATVGGSHPGAGTRNALLSLGNRRYLEIMSIDPAQKLSGQWAALVKDLKTPQLIMWAAASNDIAAVCCKIQAAGYKIVGPNLGSRVKPNIGMLNWKMLSVPNELGGLIPFFIEWGAGTIHPAEDSPQGCNLQSLEMEHPEPDRVRKMLRDLGIEATVKGGSKPRLLAVLSTPKGLLDLS